LTLDGPSGTLILSGSNSYGGGTTVNAGTLILETNRALLEGSSLTVGAGATSLFDTATANEPVAFSLEVSNLAVVAVPKPGMLLLLATSALVAAIAVGQRQNRSFSPQERGSKS
jgi:autotransporter-associated beta strand protein